jgi:lipopolysaccharide/colanic/teichoic acid biosynthesis glycosyltransferase
MVHYSLFSDFPALASMFKNRRPYPALKRLLDVLLSFLLVIVCSLVFVAISVAICLDSRGFPIFAQTRVGKNGKKFKIYKFRTMHSDIDRGAHEAFAIAFVQGQVKERLEGRSTFKPIAANEVTRVGRVLRKTSLDELPQLFNVLKGDMSLVGPRPNVVTEVNAYKDWHKGRLQALPGITGLAQVRGRSGIDFDTIVKYDLEYI